MLRSLVLSAILIAQASTASALEVRFEAVAANVYAYIGDTGPRTVDNQGLNANLGLIVTNAGAVLVDSGATAASARLIERAVRQVTDQPVRWVINTGGQDHRWLGNGYFQSQGAELIAHANSVPDMRARAQDQLAALRSLLGDLVADTAPVPPTRLIKTDDDHLVLGGVEIQLRHRRGGHTPGDMAVWLPQANVLFSGDIVYVDRLLAVLPVSNTRRWLDAFQAIEQIAPSRIVPGHGGLTDLPTAQAQTKAYLLALREHMRKAIDEGMDPSEASRRFEQTPFNALRNAAELAPLNNSRVYLELEQE